MRVEEGHLCGWQPTCRVGGVSKSWQHRDNKGVGTVNITHRGVLSVVYDLRTCITQWKLFPGIYKIPRVPVVCPLWEGILARSITAPRPFA